MRRSLAVLVGVVAIACSADRAEPQLQWTVVVATDAHVPGFADRLLIEAGRCVTELAACDGSTARIFAVDEGSWPLSFGVADASGAVAIRARLFRADRTLGGVPDPKWTLDALAQLPPIDAPTTVSLTLSMNCLGVASDPGSRLTCDARSGSFLPRPVLAPGASTAELPRPGSWRSRPCATEAPPSMVCIPGGSFVLGERDVPEPDSANPRPEPERLITLSPFFIDEDEFTIGELRELLNQGLLGLEPNSGTACHYLGRDVPDADSLPVNCVSYEMADEACRALGKRLPTEAEWEYTASNLGRETPYPWGFEADVCAHSLVARAMPVVGFGDASCLGRAGTDQTGPVAGGHAGDLNTLGVRNLAGNISELMADYYADYGDPCWNRLGPVAINPVCTRPNNFRDRVIRGGSWASSPEYARVFIRGMTFFGFDAWNVSDVGFRCVRPAVGPPP